MTISQIVAILMLLQAFGVDQTTLNNVHDILIPPIVTATTQTQNLGSTAPVIPTPQVQAPASVIQSTPMPPKWIIDVATSAGTTVQAGTGKYGFNVHVYDGSDTNKKNPLNTPVTVTTNDPDLPTSFVINAPHQVGFFCVAPTYDGFPNSGCKNENPVSVGTFDFTFTVEDVSKTVQVTVTE